MEHKIKAFLATLAIAVIKGRMYSPDHEGLDEAAAKIFDMLEEFPEGQVEVMIVEDELVLNNVLFRDSGLHGAKLVRLFKAKGISRVDFLKGVTAEEVRKFIVDLADSDKDLERYSFIRPGVMEVHLSTSGVLTDLDLSEFNEEQLSRVKAAYKEVSPFRRLEVSSLEEIVANFVVTFRRGANILSMISPVKSHSEYTYTHAMNVAVLSMSQAEYLGLNDDLVHEIGIAALMHDVGKLFISQQVLHKDGKLSDEEFDDIKRHPIFGAAYLAKMDGMTWLAPIVALEHHRKFDGSGYPTLCDNGRRQHVSSQIVAIADFFDALRSNRPYRKSLSVQETLRMMHEGEGTAFNPALIRNFAVLLMKAG
jgi:HD-GYP domain-containing protein (c-di-GMP phosphodiesterase class II)